MGIEIRPEEDVSTGYDVSVESHSDLCVGTTVSLSKVLDSESVSAFARASADTNPLHLNEDYAEETQFGGPIAHGVLTAGVVSAALARLPGIVVYLEQDMSFHAPVYVGEEVTATCEIVDDLGGEKFRIKTIVENTEGLSVMDGVATVLIEEEPTSQDDF